MSLLRVMRWIGALLLVPIVFTMVVALLSSCHFCFASGAIARYLSIFGLATTVSMLSGIVAAPPSYRMRTFWLLFIVLNAIPVFGVAWAGFHGETMRQDFYDLVAVFLGSNMLWPSLRFLRNQ
jgi:hypothetical protein